ncbi:MAG: ketoacyl-ACP synthase III [Kiritimatiellae bacterium]|jgi:3-oxoacyl-[acyl-carrier-protein] synthase-3|nr:ketoacyl-ACP synthase III [Kiritimatiellia bacterium]
MKNSTLLTISSYLPDIILTNEELSTLYSGWTAEKIFEKTGIKTRHISEKNETAGDLGKKAARKLFAEYSIDPQSIDFILFATQSPDYFLPSTACILQDQLGIPTTSGALDFNLGCSAYVYGLSLAKGLIAGNIASNVLLITAETYSKYINPMDKSTRTIFGDGAAATLISRDDSEGILEFVLGTDGSGYDRLIVPAGGMRCSRSSKTAAECTDESENVRSQDNLFMEGTDIFSFTIGRVPPLVSKTLEKNQCSIDDIDLFVFHQANKYMLNFLRKKCKIPEEKFYMNFEDCGNTVSASIPIALTRAVSDGTLKCGMKVMLVGFGVGLSWSAVVINW